MRNLLEHTRWLTLFLLTIISILICSSSFLPGALASSETILLLSFFMGFAFPSLSLAIFLLLLPIFGNRPGTTQVSYLQFIVSSIFLAITLRILVDKKLRNTLDFRSTDNKFIFLSFLYLLVSFFSLSSLPLKKAFLEARSIIPDFEFTTLVFAVNSLLGKPETTLNYVFYSVLQTAFAVYLAYYLFLFCKKNQNLAKLFTWSLLCGLILSFVAGLLDYYSLIDLRSIRKLDPVVNPGDVQFRLQSFFGHSGWYAEYLTLCIPFSLIILSLKIAYKFRVTALISLLILGEFILVLTYQRGGWVSYPITLLVIWTAIYLFRKLEEAEVKPWQVIKKSFLKVALSLPLTILLTFIIVKSLGTLGYIKDTETLNRYVDRFQEISKVSDRTDFIKAGFKVGLLHPIMGAGSESFALQYKKEFASPNGAYYKEFIHPLHGSAHNVYAQTFSGKGFIGLALLLSLSLGFMISCVKLALGENKISADKRLFLLIGASSSAAFLIYGNVQEVFYVQSLQYLFFASIGIVAGVNNELFALEKKTKEKLIKYILIFFVIHLAWEYVFPAANKNYLTQDYSYGCYSKNKNKHGKTYRWCSNNSAEFIRIKNGELNFQIYAGEFKEGNTANIEISTGSQLLKTLAIKSGETKNVQILTPSSFEKKINENQELLVKFKSDNYLIPAKKYNRQDFRVLGFQLYATP